MYCVNCGAELENDARFCWQCGAPTGVGQAPDQSYYQAEQPAYNQYADEYYAQDAPAAQAEGGVQAALNSLLDGIRSIDFSKVRAVVTEFATSDRAGLVLLAAYVVLSLVICFFYGLSSVIDAAGVAAILYLLWNKPSGYRRIVAFIPLALAAIGVITTVTWYVRGGVFSYDPGWAISSLLSTHLFPVAFAAVFALACLEKVIPAEHAKMALFALAIIGIVLAIYSFAMSIEFQGALAPFIQLLRQITYPLGLATSFTGHIARTPVGTPPAGDDWQYLGY